ncbi:MAG: transcription termination/antitermination protein NusA [Acidobacteria bacterium]|nr:MAG: transcription termination/antitermination protein NusA [Acidobacteriota bacterium]
MANILSQTIEQISKEKGIEPEVIQHALEDAMVAAAKKYFKTAEELQARYDPETGTIDVFAVKQIVETVTNSETEMSLEEALSIDESFQVGEFVEIPKPTLELGRIAAQTAKQVIFQKVREAEREIVFDEFSGQVGQLVNGIVRRFEGRDLILDMGKTEALLPMSEQSRIEQYKQGDRVRAVIVKVHKLSKGPQIIVSRTDPSLLVRLFEMEIPEVYDGTVQIKAAVREGGERAKVAVASRDDAVDPVGACVGMKGTRINAVIRELKGEKIDIIEYSEEIVEYTMNALNPAKISKVLVVDPSSKILEVIVPEDQLSLAIGKKGQNVRLASRLLGWQIDIKSEEEKKKEILSQMENLEPEQPENPVEELPGVGEKTLARLQEAGIASVQALASQTIEQLIQIPGIGEKTAQKLVAQAQALLSGEEAGEEEAAGADAAAEEPEVAEPQNQEPTDNE